VTLFIDERAVAELIAMPDALVAVREGFEAMARGNVENLPRTRLGHGEGTVRITAALAAERGYFAVKISSRAVFESNSGRILNLFELSTGKLCAVIQVFGLGALRTAAVTGVATDLLARPDADVLAVIGTGRQARRQLEAMLHVRTIKQVRVFGRDPHRRADFAAFPRAKSIETIECTDVEQAVAGASVVVTATSARDPVLFGVWLDPGVHVNAIGANDVSRRELDSEVVARADIVVVDEPLQAPLEASDLIQPVAEGIISWEQVKGLDEILAGSPGRQTAGDITLFKSMGTAVGDAMLAALVYERALQSGVGISLPDLSGTLP
jgi:ornithine cyclodeaminase/alanine dehydrogenase-like protein (mu-crystallin family)